MMVCRVPLSNSGLCIWLPKSIMLLDAAARHRVAQGLILWSKGAKSYLRSTMRLVFSILSAFFLISIFFTRWYLCTVRGLCAAAGLWEVALMIAAGLAIGFAAAWLLGERTFRILRSQVGELYKEKQSMNEQLRLLERENQSARRHVAEWQQEGSLLSQVKKVTEPLLEEARRQVESLEEELKQHHRRYENLKSETDSMRKTADQLRAELAAEREREGALLAQQEEEKIESKTTNPRTRFTMASGQKRDDLSLISGIGPGIHKKLNGIGIYTFQQIAEFTPDDIEMVTQVLKVFKGRIGRDNWIGQAAALRKK